MVVVRQVWVVLRADGRAPSTLGGWVQQRGRCHAPAYGERPVPALAEGGQLDRHGDQTMYAPAYLQVLSGQDKGIQKTEHDASQGKFCITNLLIPLLYNNFYSVLKSKLLYTVENFKRPRDIF